MKNQLENHLWKQEAPWLEFENKQKYSGDPTFAQSFCQLWQQGFQTGYLLANENLVYFGSLGQPWPFFWSKRPKIEISKAFSFQTLHMWPQARPPHPNTLQMIRGNAWEGRGIRLQGWMGRHFFALVQGRAYHEYFGVGRGRAKGSNQNPQVRARQRSNSPGEGHYVLKFFWVAIFPGARTGRGMHPC